MKFEIINRSEKDEIIERLNEQFGITELPFLLIRQGREKVRAYSGNLSREELSIIGENVNIDTLGIYLFREENGGIRLSHDAVSLPIIQKQITKNIIELNDEQTLEWLKGRDISMPIKVSGFVVLKHNDFLIGCGKASNDRITNFVPKERRIRN